jgi:hypothetical protein
MLNFFKNKIGSILIRNQRKLDEIKIQIAKNFFFNLNLNLEKILDLESVNYKVFSQHGEDGIIQYFIKLLNLKKIRFIEIGTEDYGESNTRYIYQTMNCEGLIIDPYKCLNQQIQKHISLISNKLKIHNDYICKENILYVLKKYNFNKNIDLFSIDIDGIDYWIIKELPKKLSKIFIAEYNPFFGPKLEITVPFKRNFNRTKYHYSNLCYGASLKALINLMKEKEYTFFGSNSKNTNAFFISNDYVELIKIEKPDTRNLEKFTDCNIRESKDKNGNFNFKENGKILEEIKNVEVYNIATNKIVSLKYLF